MSQAGEQTGIDASAAATLSHVADQSQPGFYSRAWAEWREEIEQRPPGPLAGGERVMPGFGGESVPCRVALPEGEPRAVLVDAPDADNQWRDVTRLLSLGVASVQVGLRDCTVGERPSDDWASHGLGEGFERGEDLLGWRLMRAAGDVGCALVAARQMGVPVFARGRSLGGGLAVLAIAGLQRMVRVERLVLELPGLGDWRHRWAVAAKASLSGGEAASSISASLLSHASRYPARRSELYDTLRVMDAALAASHVHAPTLCKLALRDPVVPPRAAAAVFNALESDTGHKWRFVVPEGHTRTGDMANARRHAEFEQCAAAFLEPDARPSEAVRRWMDRAERGSDREEGGSLFGAGGPSAEDAALVAAYERAGRTLDDLPYTPEFDGLYESVSRDGTPGRHDVLHRLQALRKAGRLPRLGRASTPPPAIDRDTESLLESLVEGEIGRLSLRDRLPYTPEFDRIVAEFNAQAGLSLGPHEVWRLVAKLAK